MVDEACMDISDATDPINLTSAHYLLLKLRIIPSSGFLWSVIEQRFTSETNAPLLRITEQPFMGDEETVTPRIGDSATQIFRLDPIAAGQSQIHFEYHDTLGMIADTHQIELLTSGTFTDVQTPSLPPDDRGTPPTEDPNTLGGTLSGMQSLMHRNVAGTVSMSNLPETFSWCNHPDGNDYCTPVQYQGLCGSCWAFTTVGAMETVIKYMDGVERDLSEQHLLSCNNGNDLFPIPWGCHGGWYAFDYYTDRYSVPFDTGPGTVWETDFPYTDGDAACIPNLDHRETLSSWSYIDPAKPLSHSYTEDIKRAVHDYGPVVSSLCIGREIISYNGGVFDTNEAKHCANVGNGTNHALVIVGWDDSERVWIARNSWSHLWGEDGYIRIKYGTSNIGFASAYVLYEGTTRGALGENIGENVDEALLAPSRPTDLSAVLTPVAPDDPEDDRQQVALTWTDNSEHETAVTVYRQQSGTGESWALIAALPANTTSYVDTGLETGRAAQQFECGQKYLYRVTMVNDAGESNVSNVAQVVPECPDLKTPMGFRVSTGETGIVLRWTNANSADEQDGVRIGRWDTEAELWLEIARVSATAIVYIDTISTEPGQTYYYVLQAYKGEQVSAATDPESAVSPLIDLNGPTNLQMMDAAGTAMTVAWQDNSTNEEGFAILQYQPEESSWSIINRVAANTTSYQVTGLGCGQATQHFIVAAYIGDLVSEYSNQVSSPVCAASLSQSQVYLPVIVR